MPPTPYLRRRLVEVAMAVMMRMFRQVPDDKESYITRSKCLLDQGIGSNWISRGLESKSKSTERKHIMQYHSAAKGILNRTTQYGR